MIKLRSKRFCRSSSKLSGGSGNVNKIKGGEKGCCGGMSEIKWELRPGGMLVQKRDTGESVGEGMITVRVSSTVSKWHDISIEATSTFGELKMILSLVTGLEPGEQRLLFKGKEREDGEYLHMVGVRDKDKVLLLEDPATKERKLYGLAGDQSIGAPFHTISV
ncbi:BAG family molecular chaperone regulator 2-like [Juglans microcarpa x Juglans regia]|uniref:BAG family molecular chaperone regulator 2-like n=1 Tax=Juglans microcarpa x Juglans regia TaxID=2249226 RepID=UPI001B7ECAD8|nr:BAG family molecular chaperone regulator 2-like [Juglans microcarpa x Juglans regia]